MYETRSNVVRVAGTSSAGVALPTGARVMKIRAHATSAGSITAPDGKGGTFTLPLPASSQWFDYEAFHLNWSAKAGDTIVFTGTDGYFVEFDAPAGV